MSKLAQQILLDLKKHIEPARAAHSPKFFDAVAGGYGEGDTFLGVAVPNQRKVAKEYWQQITLVELSELLSQNIHECRLTAIFILVAKFQKKKAVESQAEVVEFYLAHLDWVNNWDIVDSSAGKILGTYLQDKTDRTILYTLASSDHMWRQRVAMIATQDLIRVGQYEDTLKIAKILLHHEHDLIHKAVGWMLREIGNRDLATEEAFLKQHYKDIPRTMLRYAIEKFEEPKRLAYLNGEV